MSTSGPLTALLWLAQPFFPTQIPAIWASLNMGEKPANLMPDLAAEPWFSSFSSNCDSGQKQASQRHRVQGSQIFMVVSGPVGLLYKAKAKASTGLYDICAQICHNFSHLKICIESSAVEDLWGTCHFNFVSISQYLWKCCAVFQEQQ